MILSMTRRFRHNSSWSSLDDAWSGRDCPTPNQSLTPSLRDGRLFRHSETAALGRAADLAAGPLPHLRQTVCWRSSCVSTNIPLKNPSRNQHEAGMAKFGIGQAVRRVEDQRFLLGKG